MQVTTKNGYTFKVDEEDLSLASESGWCGKVYRKKLVNGDIRTYGPYITRNVVNSGIWRTDRFHRLIMNITSDMECDHINGDTLDNRKSNLRVCTRLQNAKNRDKSIHNKSGYKGVFWRGKQGKWQAQINTGGKCTHIGYFEEKEKAALAYNNAAIKAFGEFARLNEVQGVTYGS